MGKSNNLINYKLPNANSRYFYQFYDGRAFYSPNYQNRAELMGAELSDAISYVQRVGAGTKNEVGELNYGFIKKLLSKARKSFEREKILYRAVGMSFDKNPSFENESINSDLDVLSFMGKEITKYFNPPNGEKIAFLNKMNNKKFLDSLTMKSQTSLSFAKFGATIADQNNKRIGKTDREKVGKKELTKAINKAMNKTGKKSDNYKDILTLLNNDFEKMGYNIFNSIEITESLYDIIEETLKESFPEELFSLNTSKRFYKMLSYGERKERATIKRFYKVLYKKVEELTHKQSEGRKYLNGALVLTESILETPYGVEITQLIYPPDLSDSEKAINENLQFEQLADIFIEFLKVNLLKNSQDEASNQAYKYLKNNEGYIKKIIIQAYSENKTNESKLREFAQFSKNGVSGLLGEIASAISLSTDRTNAIITGSKINNLGQKVAIDTNLIVHSKNGRDVVLGIQVKNYTSTNSVRLYSDQEIKLTDNDNIYRYIPENDVKVLKFLIANMGLINSGKFDLSLSKNDLELFLHAFIPSLLRAEDLSDNLSSFKNNFYYINNRIYPTSELILEIALKAINILKEAKQKKIVYFLGIDRNEPEVINVEPGEEIEKYYTIPYQPSSIVGGVRREPRGIVLKSDPSLILPRKVNLCSQLSNIRIHFNGIRVNTNK